jgi:methionyl-tRNA formyltransferase
MRLVFAGTPQVAADTLELLLAGPHEVVAVVSRPDAAVGRSSRPVPSPVSRLALDRRIELLRPDRIAEAADRLAQLAPDAGAVVAYGGLIPQGVLELPRHGWVNVHYSLLPRWRGAAPVQHALLAGDPVTGVSVFRLVAALDAGPLFATREVTIEPGETAGDLLGRLTPIGADTLGVVLDDLAAGRARAVEQAGDGLTLAPKLAAAAGRLDWTLPAGRLERVVQASNPSPVAWTTLGGERFRVLRARVAEGPAGLSPGELLLGRRDVVVGTGDGVLELLQVQPQGRRPMPAGDWARGRHGEPARFA